MQPISAVQMIPHSNLRPTRFRYADIGHIPLFICIAEPVWRNGRAQDSRGPGFETRLCHLVFPLGNETNRHCKVAQFAGNAHWAEPSPLINGRAHPTPLKCENKYLVLALEEETSPGSSRLYCLSVSLAQNAKESGDERPIACPNSQTGTTNSNMLPLIFVFSHHTDRHTL